MELKRLLRAKHLDLAWYQFNYMQKLTQADAHQYAVMMGTLESSKKQFEFFFFTLLPLKSILGYHKRTNEVQFFKKFLRFLAYKLKIIQPYQTVTEISIISTKSLN